MVCLARALGALLVVLLLLPWSAPPRAQTSDTLTSDMLISDAQAPPVKGAFGLDVRFRDELLHNALDFNTDANSGPASDSHYYRLRVRASAKAILRWGPVVCARVTAEPIKFVDPYLTPAKTEVILDNAYLDIPRLPFLPARLRAGRFDYPLGEGFLFMDGGPGDGSRSYYENAVVLELDNSALGLGEGTSSLIAIRNLMRDPMVLANDSERLMIEKDETAFGLHLAIPKFGAKNELLYIYKEEMHGADKASTPPDTRLHTLGFRTTGDLPWQVSCMAEGAYQFGERLDWRTGEKLADQHGVGAHGWASRSFTAPLMPKLTIGAIGLSGDNPRTDCYEGWSPLFSRWPMWSELCIYSLILEQGRVAYWQNLVSLHAALSLRLNAAIGFSYTCRYLRAVHGLPAGTAASLGTGIERGVLHIWQLTAALSQHMSMRLIAERLAPGDFYAAPRDDAYFVRWEIAVQR